MNVCWKPLKSVFSFANSVEKSEDISYETTGDNISVP